MSRSPDWEQIRTTVVAHLTDGEPVKGIFTAFVPPPDDRRGLPFAGLPPIMFAPIEMAVSQLTWQATVRKASQTAGVPLARRMVIALTSRRLVIWRASRRWELREVTGDLPLGRIGDVRISGSGSRSRTVVLHLKTGGNVTVKVPPNSANRLQKALS